MHIDLDCGELVADSWHLRSAEKQESLDSTAMSASPAEGGHCPFGIWRVKTVRVGCWLPAPG